MKAAMVRLAVSGVLVAAGSLLPAMTASAKTHAYPLGEFAFSSGNWQSFNQTASASGPKVVSATSSVVTAQGTMASFGVSKAGALIEYTDDGLGGRLWNSYDLSTATAAASATGRPAAVVAAANLQVFYRGTDSHLWMLALDQLHGRPWNAYDLSTLASLGEISSSPLASVDSRGLVRIAVANSLGEVNLIAHDGRFSHAWNAYNLGLVSGGPKAVGSVAIITDSGGFQRLFYRSTNGHLIELMNNRRSTAIWAIRDLTVRAAIVVDGDPSVAVVSGKPVILGVHSGHLVEAYLSDQGWLSLDRSVDDQALASTQGSPAVLATGGRNYVEIARTKANHLVKLAITGLGQTAGVRDLSMQPNVLATVATDPSLVEREGGLHLFAGIAGSITPPPPPPPTATVVSIAISQDQSHAKIVETPAGSNCNPFSAYFHRGKSLGCAPNTSSEAWCSDFAQWVWDSAGGIDTTGITGWSFTFVTWGQAHGSFKRGANNNPQIGDAVVWGDWASSYGAHVGLVTGVKGKLIKVTSGNSGPSYDAQGNVISVWTSAYFDPSTSVDGPYGILGYTSPVTNSGGSAIAPQARVLGVSPTAEQINSQDGGH